MKMDGGSRASIDIRGAVSNPSPAMPEAHRIMIERVIKESSLERLFDLSCPDYAQARRHAQSAADDFSAPLSRSSGRRSSTC